MGPLRFFGQDHASRVEQTVLKRKGAAVDVGEAEGFDPPKKRTGRGRGCGRGRAAGRGQRSKGNPATSMDAEPEIDWEDVCKEWDLWQVDRAAAWAAREVAGDQEQAQTRKKKVKGTAEPKNPKKAKEREATVEDENGGMENKEVSFARRPPPKTDQKYKRWQATKAAFEDKIALFVTHPSKYQDCLLLHVHPGFDGKPRYVYS